VAAWKKAGASIGWTVVDCRFDRPAFREGVEGKKGEVPAFTLVVHRHRGDDTTNLPQPQTPFGLRLHFVTDAGLKDFAKMTSLQSLDLTCCNHVTDAGIRELAKLKNLQSLDLTYTQVTDAGLKELVALKNLQSLTLGNTQVTDAGLKELAGLKSLQSLNFFAT